VIRILCGEPGVGKTSFLSNIASTAMFDRQRYKRTRNAIQRKIDGGFPYTIPPQHSVYTNFHCVGRKWRYHPRQSWHIDPSRLGLMDKTNFDPNTHLPLVDVQFIPPHSVICITEAQEHFDSRAYRNFKPFQSRFFERHRHNGLDIWLDVQRHDLIDKNIRELAEIVEIVRKQDVTSELGRVLYQKWTIRRFQTCDHYEAYKKSGKELRNYTEEIITSSFDVHRTYDSCGCEPDFYEGNLNNDFEYEKVAPPKQTINDYVRYFHERQRGQI